MTHTNKGLQEERSSPVSILKCTHTTSKVIKWIVQNSQSNVLMLAHFRCGKSTPFTIKLNSFDFKTKFYEPPWYKSGFDIKLTQAALDIKFTTTTKLAHFVIKMDSCDFERKVYELLRFHPIRDQNEFTRYSIRRFMKRVEVTRFTIRIDSHNFRWTVYEPRTFHVFLDKKTHLVWIQRFTRRSELTHYAIKWSLTTLKKTELLAEQN